MKRKLSFFSIVVVTVFIIQLLFAMTLVAPAQSRFNDIIGHWAQLDIEALVAAGIVKGTSETEFSPNAPITRAEFLALVCRAAGINGMLYNDAFPDVHTGDWYAETVAGAVNANIIDREMVPNGEFLPNQPITREEMTSMIINAIKFMKKEVPAGATLTFSDTADSSAWAEGYIAQAVSLGIVKGLDGNVFRPANNATRAEAAVIVKRFMDIAPTLPKDKNLTIVVHDPIPVPAGVEKPAFLSDDYFLVFCDDFEGNKLDESKWSYSYPWGKTHNHGAYCVPENVIVENGLLRLKAENKRHPDAPQTTKGDGNTQISVDYTSGAVNTNGKFNLTTGYIEARMKLPKGKGLWPAFWMLQNGWPPEVDILEVLGSKPDVLMTNYHYGPSWNNKWSHYQTFKLDDFSQGFHTFGFEWTPTAMRWYYDGKQVGKAFTKKEWIAQSKNMYIILNLAVDGWDGKPDASTQFPAYYDIDWVRVWQKEW